MSFTIAGIYNLTLFGVILRPIQHLIAGRRISYKGEILPSVLDDAIFSMIDIPSLFVSIAHAQEAVNEASNSGIAGTFGLDWMKFIGQLLNFGIVLFILWKWVFTPVTKALEKRTEKIEKSLRDAENTAKEKEEFSKWKNEEMVKTRHEASSIITAAQTDAGKAKDEILAQAKAEQQKLVEQAKKQIESEKQQALTSAKSELADLVTMATEKVLRQKLDGKKDSELVKESLKSI